MDNYIIHKSKKAQRWLESNPKFKLLFLPVYSPWHNKIELLWHSLHETVTRNHSCKSMEELMERVEHFMDTASPFPGNRHGSNVCSINRISYLEFAGDLTKLRFKFSAWLTNDIDLQLIRFEDKLRTLGANSEYIKMSKGEGTNQEHRDQAARELLEILSAFTSWKEPSSTHPEVQLNYVQNSLRDVLGVNKLVKIRELIVQNANSQLTNKGNQTR